VILDVKMPVLHEISAAERVAAQQIAPVVILTAFSQWEDPWDVPRPDTTRGTHLGHPEAPPGHPGTPPVKY
jgi:CheY-like chemotaxis protein